MPISELDARLASNPGDFFALFYRLWGTEDGSWEKTDNSLYPDWNPSPVIDCLPVA